MQAAAHLEFEFIDSPGVSPPRDTVNDARQCRAGFALFLCVNAALFIRPAEILADFKDLPAYEVLMILCLLTSLPAVIRVLRWSYLVANPQVLLILALLPAVFLSNLVHHDLWLARMGALEFSKLLVYFVLLLGLVDSPARLRILLITISALVLVTAAVCLLQYHNAIDLNLQVTVTDQYGSDADTGDALDLPRLQATGLFSDPNDFSLVLGAAMMVGTHMLLEQKRWLARLLWLPPIALLGYAFALTHSRGGFLALVGGGLVMMLSRLGWRRTIPWALVLMPLLFFLFGGRQTNIDLNNPEDTAQGRILLWRDSLVLFKTSPIFGIGWNQLPEVNGMVAHNSYVHAYAELGLVGGTAFIGAWYLLIASFRRFRPLASQGAPDELDRWHPCVAAVAIGYGIGLISLTRLSSAATYLVLGSACAYCALRGARVPGVVRPLSNKLLGKVVLVSLGCLALLHLTAVLFVR